MKQRESLELLYSICDETIWKSKIPLYAYDFEKVGINLTQKKRVEIT